MSQTPNNPSPQRVSNAAAIWRGMLWVNFPVAGLIVAGWIFFGGILALLAKFEIFPAAVLVNLQFAVLVLGISPAWLWWSYSVPRWRLWAMERTNDWPSLEQSAIRVGLIWNESSSMGRFFARTEIWSPALRRRETTLLARYGRPARGN